MHVSRASELLPCTIAALIALTASSCVSPNPPRRPATLKATEPSLVELTTGDAAVPLGTPHLLVATVLDDGGRPVHGARIEWVVVAGSVGGIIAVDDGIELSDRVPTPLRAASSTTSSGAYLMPVDGADVRIREGQTWCVVSSDELGEMDVLVYSPQLPDRLWGEIHVVRSWVDATCEWPLDAESAPGSVHTLATRVLGPVDGSPRMGYLVTYELLDGTTDVELEGGDLRASTTTGATGIASTTLTQLARAVGWNEIRVTVAEPRRADGVPGRVLATHVVRKIWR